MDHTLFMRRCLQLAEQARGDIGNGALVASLLVRSGKIIAEDCYSGFSNLHAERAVLSKFDQKIDTEDILYVNLEPCCHTGKTPPCTNYLIEKGVKHVVFGMVDPDPRVSGKGIAQLREAGVEVIGPVLRAECEWLNRGFISLRTKHRPWITLKIARTRSGEIAKPDGSPMKITSAEQDAWSHERLRAESDAILVGVGTVIADNPLLTIRNTNNKFEQPYRIILDASLNTPFASKVVTDEHASRTIIIVDPKNASGSNARDLVKHGAQIFPVAMKDGQFVWGDLWKVLTEPRGEYHGVASILVEGGRKTWDMFKEAGMVDEEIVLIGR